MALAFQTLGAQRGTRPVEWLSSEEELGQVLVYLVRNSLFYVDMGNGLKRGVSPDLSPSRDLIARYIDGKDGLYSYVDVCSKIRLIHKDKPLASRCLLNAVTDLQTYTYHYVERYHNINWRATIVRPAKYFQGSENLYGNITAVSKVQDLEFPF